MTAVAEAWVAPDRRVRYASRDGLGQAFNFDLLQADWDPAQFRRIIRDNLDARGHESGASSTWVFSNHDVVRHATRFALPGGNHGPFAGCSPAPIPRSKTARGLRRARAATLLAPALPGSMYLYQGEELGLPEVADIPDADKQDPAFFRDKGSTPTRDGCRVPLPWTATGASFGFGTRPAAPTATGVVRAVRRRRARMQIPIPRCRSTGARLSAATELQTDEEIEWMEHDDPIVSFRRAGGWASLTNFGAEPAPLPAGTVVIASAPLDEPTLLPPDTTVWMRVAR